MFLNNHIYHISSRYSLYSDIILETEIDIFSF